MEQRSVEFFSLLIIKEVSSAHSGTYTCVASNNAAKSNFSSELVVRGWKLYIIQFHQKAYNINFHVILSVAPQWIYEPHDVSTLIGTPVKIHCAAKGFPIPQVTWMKGQGKSI